jgi:thiamine biosynthesis lipoprotein
MDRTGREIRAARRPDRGRGRLAVLLMASGIVAGCLEPGHETRRFEAFGDPASVEVHTAAAGDTAPLLDELIGAVGEVEAWLAPDGPLARLNRGAVDGYYTFPDDEQDFYRCVRLAMDYAQGTRGAFDPTVGPLTRLYRRAYPEPPGDDEIGASLHAVGWQHVTMATETRALRFREPGMELDLGGLIKGFALDMAARSFARAGTHGASLRIGCNLYAWGEPPGAKAWDVEVPDPRDPRRSLLRVRTTNRGLAVAGRRDDGAPPGAVARVPVLVAAEGRPAGGSLLAALAIADSAADADALATALAATGFLGAAAQLERMYRVEAVLLVQDVDGGAYLVASASLRDLLELSPELEAETGGRVRYQLPPESIALPL